MENAEDFGVLPTNDQGESHKQVVDGEFVLPKINSDLRCECSDSPVPTEVQCPICRAPAVWCSLKCAESHLRGCATTRAVIAQSVCLKTSDYGQLHVRCCNCNNKNLAVNWCRSGICYELKWCSFECIQSDPTEHIATCFRHAGLSLERSILTKSPMINDSAVSRAHVPFCDRMTWAWTPAGGAKPESKNVIMSMMIHVQAMPENVKTQLLDPALHDMQLRQRKARILLGRVRDLDPRVAKCFLLKSAPAARVVLHFAHPVFSMNDSSTLTGTKTQDEFDYPLRASAQSRSFCSS
jgi:hypothetical protein